VPGRRVRRRLDAPYLNAPAASWNGCSSTALEGEQGYAWFNLGMGLCRDGAAARHRQASAAGAVFRHGEHFYNFQDCERTRKIRSCLAAQIIGPQGGLALPRIPPMSRL
jgi:hypothetical protein